MTTIVALDNVTLETDELVTPEALLASGVEINARLEAAKPALDQALADAAIFGEGYFLTYYDEASEVPEAAWLSLRD